jgi:2-keto-4-pentenoate hydratase
MVLAIAILSGAASCPAVGAAEEESAIIEDWLDARERGTDVPALTRRLPSLGLDQAYAVQEAVVVRRVAAGDRRVGYKLGFTSAGARERFGVESPAHGRLLDSMEVAGTSAVESDGFSRVFVEVEIAFTVARRVDVVPDDPRGLRAYVATAHPAIELPDMRFASDAHPGFADFVADGVGAHRFALGEGRPVGELDLASAEAVLERDGRVLAQGRGADAMGDPWIALLWLVRDLAARGRSLEAGEVVLTGALGRVQVFAPEEAAGRYRARVDGLGQVEVEVR